MKLHSFLSMVLATLALSVIAQENTSEELDSMSDELMRNFETLQDEEKAPFYMSYEISEDKQLQASGSYGSLTNASNNIRRNLSVDLRIGTPLLDNTHLAGTPQLSLFGPVAVDKEVPLKSFLWDATNDAYQAAKSQLTNVETEQQTRVEEEDKSGSFVPSTKEEFVADYLELEDTMDSFKEKIKLYGLPFKYEEHIQSNNVTISGTVDSRWFVNSEGSKIRQSEPYYRIFITASTKAEDGMVLPRSVSYEALTVADFPTDEQVLADVQDLIAELKALRVAPLAEPYAGPAILSARAAGVFFHEILGHRLEGHRQKSDSDGQTFKKKLGEQILPENFSIYFDPNIRTYKGLTLWGFYHYDHQGVKGLRVDSIENGILKRFLMSRRPIDEFPYSNGHGRRQGSSNYGAVARQSNLIVEVENPLSEEELTRMLIQRVSDQGLEFGLMLDDIQGGFAITGRAFPNSFQVNPLVMYRIYADGTKEYVRGVTFIGTPLTTIGRIEAGADDYGTFNGYCGAESGNIPVSAVSPSILISQIEVQKISADRSKPPILPSPVQRDDEVTFHNFKIENGSTN